ncbi:MAG: hypothetical protein LQ340_004537 [Diploschistes diacapsis]|nr:MAG: hypothetical protein LQ340_004537 [Diploschistes diacapsis]
MPLWRIYHPDNYFTASEKSTLARSITTLYTHLLPAFYVEVLFIPMPASSMYVGGEQRTDYVRLVGEHIARNFDGDKERMLKMMQRVTAAVGPVMKDKGAHWEAHIDQTPYELWTIGGMQPPQPGSDAEKLWKKENRAVPY